MENRRLMILGMIDYFIYYITFIIGVLLVLFLCFAVDSLVIRKLDENGDEMFLAVMYPIEEGILSQLGGEISGYEEQ